MIARRRCKMSFCLETQGVFCDRAFSCKFWPMLNKLGMFTGMPATFSDVLFWSSAAETKFDLGVVTQ